MAYRECNINVGLIRGAWILFERLSWEAHYWSLMFSKDFVKVKARHLSLLR